jgi:hypothetical protein
MHILVIGAAGNDRDASRGQLPAVENILAFMAQRPGQQCYFYFIDPEHANCRGDMEKFRLYHERGIAHCMVPRNFRFATFHSDYRVGRDEEAFFIDYANLAASEFDLITSLGVNPSWSYLCPGCAGPRLNLSEAYARARTIPQYTIQGSLPVPAGLSPEYLRGIRRELESLLTYVRLLPSERGRQPPEWLMDQVGRDPGTWSVMREQAHATLAHFFNANGIADPDCTPLDQWYTLVNRALGPSGRS